MESRNAERIRLRAERGKLKATDPQGLADAWAMIGDIWSGTVARARKLPEPVLHEQVDGEWSFVQTHRHLVLATDCWLRRMVKGMAHPYHPGHPRKSNTVLKCLQVILNEEWQHHRYAVRDLAVLEKLS